jgi:hypothetical protein
VTVTSAVCNDKVWSSGIWLTKPPPGGGAGGQCVSPAKAAPDKIKVKAKAHNVFRMFMFLSDLVVVEFNVTASYCMTRHLLH